MKKFRNPFTILRHWAQQHHNSLSSFTSNFIATVLGIVLTFGTTMWYENREKKEAAETLVENCLSNMEDRLANIDRVVAIYDRHDELFNQVQQQPLDSLSDELMGNLIYEYTRQYDLVINHSYEKSFSQSVTSHEILGRYSEVIGTGFEILLYVEQLQEEVNKKQGELLERQIMARNTEWDKGSMKLVVAETLNDPFFVNFQNWFTKRADLARHMQNYLHLYIPEARRLWSGEITKEEFRSETDKRWNEWASSQQ